MFEFIEIVFARHSCTVAEVLSPFLLWLLAVNKIAAGAICSVLLCYLITGRWKYLADSVFEAVPNTNRVCNWVAVLGKSAIYFSMAMLTLMSLATALLPPEVTGVSSIFEVGLNTALAILFLIVVIADPYDIVKFDWLFNIFKRKDKNG